MVGNQTPNWLSTQCCQVFHDPLFAFRESQPGCVGAGEIRRSLTKGKDVAREAQLEGGPFWLPGAMRQEPWKGDPVGPAGQEYAYCSRKTMLPWCTSAITTQIKQVMNSQPVICLLGAVWGGPCRWLSLAVGKHPRRPRRRRPATWPVAGRRRRGRRGCLASF